MTTDEEKTDGADVLEKINDRIELLKKQQELLSEQQKLLSEQQKLQTTVQSQEAKTAKAIADELKNQVAAEYGLEAEKAKAPFATLAGVTAATKDMELPTGKEGTITIAAGTEGTALLRSKKQMLILLDAVAAEMARDFPGGAVIVTEAQLDEAYQADFFMRRLAEQRAHLNVTIERATPQPVQPEEEPETPITRAFSTLPSLDIGDTLSFISPLTAAVPATTAAAYSLGFVMDTVNSLAKLFRVDRTLNVFGADTEAAQILGYLLESKSLKFMANPVLMRDEVLDIADSLTGELNELLKGVHRGEDLVAELKKISDDEDKKKLYELPGDAVIDELKSQVKAARELLDGIHPAKKPDEFWKKVKGGLILKAIEKRSRMLLAVKAQAVQITEKRWWTSDRLCMAGEVQVHYRVLGDTGKVVKSGVLLKASGLERVKFNQVPWISFPGNSPEKPKTAK
ncbi:MAG: hypothetical protein JXA51_02140 [Dehalococcoidales bacterium]|nr:hypothetical protein [Dehalococcoidales bacterium]